MGMFGRGITPIKAGLTPENLAFLRGVTQTGVPGWGPGQAGQAGQSEAPYSGGPLSDREGVPVNPPGQTLGGMFTPPRFANRGAPSSMPDGSGLPGFSGSAEVGSPATANNSDSKPPALPLDAPGGPLAPKHRKGVGGVFEKVGGWLSTPDREGMTGAERLQLFGVALAAPGAAVAMRNAMENRHTRNAFMKELGGALGLDGSRGLPTFEEVAPLLISGSLRGIEGMDQVGAFLRQMRQPAPQSIEGPDGIYERGPQGWQRAMAYPDKPETVSPGWKPRADGKGWEPVSGGPYDPEYIGRAAGTRRDVVVSRPMPQRGGGGGRSGGGSVKVRVIGATLPEGY